MADLENRVSVLETQMASVQEDLAEIKAQIGQAATKQDVQDLQQFFDDRDHTYTHNLWRLVFGLVILVALIAAGAVGISLSEVGPLFGR